MCTKLNRSEMIAAICRPMYVGDADFLFGVYGVPPESSEMVTVCAVTLMLVVAVSNYEAQEIYWKVQLHTIFIFS